MLCDHVAQLEKSNSVYFWQDPSLKVFVEDFLLLKVWNIFYIVNPALVDTIIMTSMKLRPRKNQNMLLKVFTKKLQKHISMQKTNACTLRWENFSCTIKLYKWWGAKLHWGDIFHFIVRWRFLSFSPSSSFSLSFLWTYSSLFFLGSFLE